MEERGGKLQKEIILLSWKSFESEDRFQNIANITPHAANPKPKADCTTFTLAVGQLVGAEVKFVHAVSAGGSVKFLPAV